MKIVQITDLHINSENEEVRGDIDVRANFLKLIAELKSLTYDYLIVSGDLSLSEGDTDTYKWIKTHLDNLDKPYFVISGNHDDNRMLADAFDLSMIDNQIYFKQELGNQTVYFLDTSCQTLSQQQMEWLGSELESDSNPTPIVFIHHPPVVSGVKYMDINHPLKNIPETMSFFQNFTNKEFYIFCGHCHAENTVFEKNMKVFITPSNYFQMKKELNYIEVENNYTSYRIIDANDKGIKSIVKYIK